MDQFYSTENFSVGQRKESFNRWMSDPTSKEKCDVILEKLNTQNYHDRIFYIDALVHFRKSDKMYEILKEGNELFCTKILKQHWFLEDVFSKTSEEDLVNKVFPYLSPVLQKKCVKQLSLCWPEKRIDELYDAIYNRYGLSAAIRILHKCSLDKLDAVLKENEIKLRPNQVIQLFKSNETKFKLYIEHHKAVWHCTYSEKKVINYVALKNPELLLELRDLGKLEVGTLGRRTTKHVVELKIESLHETGIQYVDLLNKPVLVKKLGHKFPILFKKVIPSGFPQVSSGKIQFPNNNTEKFEILLQKYPKKLRWSLFYQIYFEKFPNSTEENLMLACSIDLIRLVYPPSTFVLDWARLKSESEEGSCYWRFLPSEEYITLIKRELALTKSASYREELLCYLIKCCGETKDLNALEESLKYILEKYKLERSSTLSAVTDITIRLFRTDLAQKHWEYINELFKIIAISDLDIYSSRKYNDYLQFLFKNGLSTKEAIKNLIDSVFQRQHWFRFEIRDNPTQKAVYAEFCEQLSEVNLEQYTDWSEKYCIHMTNLLDFCLKSAEYSIDLRKCLSLKNYIDSLLESRNFDCHKASLLERVIMYNQAYPEYAVNVDNSALIDACIECLTNTDYRWYLKNVTSTLINKKDRNDLANKFLVKYFEVVYNVNPDDVLVNKLLQHEPKTVMPYFDQILAHCFESPDEYKLDNKILKIYSHVGLVDKVKNYFIKNILELHNNDTNTIRSYFMMVYPLFSIDEFIRIVDQKFVPHQDKLDLTSNEMCDMYKDQCIIAGILGNVDEPYKMLPTIMKFARGDYLQSVLPSLYRAFRRSPERLLYSYVNQLSNQAVSARKHALHLSCAVLSNEQVVNMLQTEQTNVSSQKYFFTAMSKYFVKNPSDAIFDKFISNINSIDKYDSETLTSLFLLSIPKKYINHYIQCCLHFIEGLELTFLIKKQYLEQCLSYVSQVSLTSLSWELLIYIINTYFVKDAPIDVCNINNFVVKTLNEVDEIEMFEMVFDILYTYDRKSLNAFLDSFLESALKNNVNRKCVDMFSKFWSVTFERMENLKSHISLKLLILKLDNNLVDNFAKGVLAYTEQLTTEFGPLVLRIVVEQITDILKHLPDIDMPTFYLTILDHKCDTDTCVFVLETIDMTANIDLSNYEEVLQKISNINIPIVKALYSYLIMKHKNEE